MKFAFHFLGYSIEHLEVWGLI